MRRLLMIVTAALLLGPTLLACSSTKKDNTLTFEYGGGSTELTISDEVVRGLLEDALDSEIDCDGDLDPPFRTVLEQLERKPKGRASIQGSDSTLYAKRRGGTLDLRIDAQDGGRIEAKMPWAVAECMLGRSTTLDEALGSGRVPIEVKITSSEGTRITARLGS